MADAKILQTLAPAIITATIAACSPAPPTSVETPPDTAQTDSRTQSPPAVDPAAPAAPSPDPIVSGTSAGGPNIAIADETLSFAAALPQGSASDPVIAELRRDAEGYLASLKTNARADFNRLKRAGVQPRPWEVRLNWKYTAKAGDIVSLVGQANEYSGGAHPMQRFDTHIARTDGAKLAIGDMLVAKRSPSPAMTIAICEALKTAKQAKIKSPTILDEPIICVGPDANAKTEDAKLALAPSNQPDKFGGVYVYYDPYAVGAYAEGPYILTVQQEVFAEDLKPEFKPLFGGEAPPPR